MSDPAQPQKPNQTPPWKAPEPPVQAPVPDEVPRTPAQNPHPAVVRQPAGQSNTIKKS